ncbi:MAG TPA: serine/threonine-protein kinase [Kofleriaceae bacterium]
MSSGAREIELDKTAQAPAGSAKIASQAAGTADTAAPLAVGTEDTAAAPSTSRSVALPAGRAPRRIFLASAAVAATTLGYFVVRFVLAADPPALHPAFVGKTGGGAFAALGVFDGPYLTLVRMSIVGAVFLAIALWSSHHHRRDLRVQLIAAVAAVAGQFSIAVAVLTSQETIIAWRVLAAVIYVGLPLVTFALLAVFPNGRAVPRWAPLAIPVVLAPFVVQAAIMFDDRAYSVAVATFFFPGCALFLGFQWHRYRTHATVRERYQIKWLCYAGAAFAMIQAVAVIGVIPLLADRDSAAFPFFRILFELLLASSYLVGLMSLLFSGARYRLWEVDRVINRTIVYAIVTLLLLAASAVAFFGLRAALPSALPPAANIAISIAIVIALAAPLRRRIARWIDRRFYGIGLDYEALAAKAVRAAHTTLPTTGTEFASYDELVLLGRGGMGAVYRAHHADFGVPVALKVMSPQLAQDADAQARFRRESQILEDLRHPNVVPFLAAGHEAGLAFIAMQYIEGDDLGAVVRQRGPLAITDVARLVTGIAAALDLAHARGVVHRDIKPANLLLEGAPDDPLATRRALVMDFGVAHLVPERPEVKPPAEDEAAPDGSLVGSLPYIAPEQIHDADAVDARADVYALGATVYELVTGRPPFVESTALGLVLAHMHQPPLDPRAFAAALPEPAARAILVALAKDPAQRYASASDFAAALTSAARP